MNIGKLIFAIQEKIAAPTTTSLELLMLKKALEKLEVGAVDVLPYYSSLPDATLNTGKLYYVSADESLYWSAGDIWRSIRITSKNYVWAWGQGESGQLGDGTTVNKSSPVSIVGGFEDWCDISIGGNVFGNGGSGAAIRSNGTAWSWGFNNFGQLGNNTTVSRSSPVSVVGFTDWCQISRSNHTLAIRTNGTIWSWGNNSSGQLGDNSTTSRSSPVSVVGGFTNWRQISVSAFRSTGIKQDGTAWAWGTNGFGALGDGTTTNKSSPVSVVGGFTDWIFVSSGDSLLGGAVVGLRCNGTLWAWGDGSCGFLGDGTTVAKSSPVSVIGGLTDWCAVSTGYHSALALRCNGTAWAWGDGQLGDGTTVKKSSPVSVIGGFTDWCQISNGTRSSTAIRSNGTAWAWGSNTRGPLGDGTTVNRSSPVSVVGGFTNWCWIESSKSQSLYGSFSTLAIRSTSF